MPLVSFKELMAGAERGQYAVGYFESWNLESLQAVAGAAEATRSPVILGFSGLSLPHPARLVQEDLHWYAALGLAACQRLSVPACLLFNESPRFDWVTAAIELGFGLVMFTDETLSEAEQIERVRQIVAKAHQRRVAVEGEVTSLPGVSGALTAAPADLRLTDPHLAHEFVTQTGVDALAVNIGQAHLHGRQEVRLNLPRLAEIKAEVSIPLVLHGATSVVRADLVEAIRLGVRKINVGSALKRAYFEAIRQACQQLGADYNPYEVVGSGLPNDILVAGRIAVQETVTDFMHMFGSAGQAGK